MKLLRNLFFIILAVLFIINCVSSKEYTGDIDKISGDDVILVGCIELKPPLEDHEQYLEAIGGEYYRNSLFFSLGDKILDYDDRNLSHINEFVKVILGQDFYIKQKYHKQLYISCQFIYMELSYPIIDMYLPGVFQIEVPEGCKVAYIGKIKYHRDIYSAITRIEIIDDYKNAKSELEKKYNKQVDMCRAKIKLIEENQ